MVERLFEVRRLPPRTMAYENLCSARPLEGALFGKFMKSKFGASVPLFVAVTFSQFSGNQSAAPGKPWVFRTDAVTHDAAIEQALLAQRFHIVVPPLTPQLGAVRTQWNNAYDLTTAPAFPKSQ